jgi:hypothetical protein
VQVRAVTSGVLERLGFVAVIQRGDGHGEVFVTA